MCSTDDAMQGLDRLLLAHEHAGQSVRAGFDTVRDEARATLPYSPVIRATADEPDHTWFSVA
jgi:hypothetical protein